MGAQVMYTLEGANAGFALLFGVEMACKHVAYGAAGYWAEPFNRFDGLVVIMSVAEVASGYVEAGVHGPVLRAFRLLRVFKLLRTWPSLQRVLNALLGSLQSFVYLMLLLALLLFVFALLGMQVSLPPCAEPP